jgi:hypothetical protein
MPLERPKWDASHHVTSTKTLHDHSVIDAGRWPSPTLTKWSADAPTRLAFKYGPSDYHVVARCTSDNVLVSNILPRSSTNHRGMVGLRSSHSRPASTQSWQSGQWDAPAEHRHAPAPSQEELRTALVTGYGSNAHEPKAEGPLLPILLPHKLDWVQLAYDRSPEMKAAREKLRRCREEARKPHAKGILADAILGTPRALPTLPKAPSASLFEESDMGIDDDTLAMLHVDDPPKTAEENWKTVRRANAAARTIARSRSEEHLNARLITLGALKRWKVGDHSQEANYGRDKWSLVSFDRICART